MALDTFTSLKTAIATWANRTGDTEFVASVPDFITMAESRFNQRLRVREMEASTTISVSGDSYALPGDYIEARRVVADTDPNVVLTYITPDQATEAFAGVVVSSGYPSSYTILAQSLYVSPTTTADVVLDYYQTITALSSTNATNWLLLKAPQVYLYGALLEAAPYTMDDARAPGWKALLDEAIKDLHSVDLRANYSRARAGVRGATP